MLRALFVQASHYSIGSVLVMLAGIISFPIITRLLSVSEYGLMALIASILVLLQALGKAGLQHSVIRYYAEIKQGRTTWNLGQYYPTAVLGMGAISLVVAVVWLLALLSVPQDWFDDQRLRYGLLLTTPLIAIEVLSSAMKNVLRAQERTLLLNTVSVVTRYIEVALTISILYFVSRSIFGFFSALIISSVLTLLVTSYLVLKDAGFNKSAYSWDLQKDMLKFGIPLIGVEAATVLIHTTDNYAIQWILGSEYLGVYAAAYNLSNYIAGFVITAFAIPARPMYMRIYAEDGAETTREFIERTLHIYWLVAMPLIVGSIATGTKILALVASAKYQAGGPVIPFTIAGLVIAGTIRILSIGLYINKKSGLSLILLVCAAVLNLVLNLALIPRYGIVGAAVATLISAVSWAAMTYFVSNRYFQYRMPVKYMATTALASGIMYLAVSEMDAGSGFLGLMLQVAAGGLAYSILIVALDPLAKKLAGTVMKRVGLAA